ncbi:retrotransposon protein, putative, ty1-copia subclass [Tanacetum coccineum]|uniref:Retrotransposon protein, putative, ty1-copia subclass n=1 Tax=Tanacetum coccineum TaxID=301880 RepID=A0ABQ5BRX5_9ASTR
MVRSMMSQTTLPKSFWDYALESVARILNMVPTKKVDRTPYEVWHGQAPKLSYLKVWGCEALVKNSLINQEASRSLKDLEIIQEEDTHPSIDTSLNHKEDDLEIDDNLKVIFNSHSTGYVFVLNGGAVDWKSAKQSIFATSSAEAEYIVAYDASKEAV